MYCKHCGKEISDDSKFCNYCGSSLFSISFMDGDNATSVDPKKNESKEKPLEFTEANEADWVDYFYIAIKTIGGGIIVIFLLLLMMMYLPNFYLGMTLSIVGAIVAHLIIRRHIRKKNEGYTTSRKELNPLFYVLLLSIILVIGAIAFSIIKHSING